MKMVTGKMNPTEIYTSDDILLTDSHFSFLHYESGEEMVTDDE